MRNSKKIEVHLCASYAKIHSIDTLSQKKISYHFFHLSWLKQNFCKARLIYCFVIDNRAIKKLIVSNIFAEGLVKPAASTKCF